MGGDQLKVLSYCVYGVEYLIDATPQESILPLMISIGFLPVVLVTMSGAPPPTPPTAGPRPAPRMNGPRASPKLRTGSWDTYIPRPNQHGGFLSGTRFPTSAARHQAPHSMIRAGSARSSSQLPCWLRCVYCSCRRIKGKLFSIRPKCKRLGGSARMLIAVGNQT